MVSGWWQIKFNVSSRLRSQSKSLREPERPRESLREPEKDLSLSLTICRTKTRLAVDRDKPLNGVWRYGMGMTQGYQLSQGHFHLNSLKRVFDNVLHEHGGLPHVLSLVVHLEELGKPPKHSRVLRAGI